MLTILTISMIDMQRKMDRRFIVYEFKYFYCKGCFFFFNALTNIPKSLVPSQNRIEERLTSTLDVKSNLKLTSYGVGSRLIFPVCFFLTCHRSVNKDGVLWIPTPTRSCLLVKNRRTFCDNTLPFPKPVLRLTNSQGFWWESQFTRESRSHDFCYWWSRRRHTRSCLVSWARRCV